MGVEPALTAAVGGGALGLADDKGHGSGAQMRTDPAEDRTILVNERTFAALQAELTAVLFPAALGQRLGRRGYGRSTRVKNSSPSSACLPALRSVNTEVWEDFVFVHLDPNPKESLKTWLAEFWDGYTGYFANFQQVTGKFLNKEIGMLGFIPSDVHVPSAVKKQVPFTIAYPNSQAARAMHERLLAQGHIGQREITKLTLHDVVPPDAQQPGGGDPTASPRIR